jgi:hypothetical protein
MMSCQHYTEPSQCAVNLTPQACAVCTDKAHPAQSVNEVTVSLAHGQEIAPEAKRQLLDAHGHLLRRQMPSWAQQAWSAATAVTDWLKAGAHGVPREQYEARLQICDACPNRDGHRCRRCGCFVRAKASLPTEKCPIGLWSNP